MVGAPVSVLHLYSVRAGRQRHYLMSQTDGKDGYIRIVKLFHLGNDPCILLGITGTV